METILIQPYGYSTLLQNLLNTAHKVRSIFPGEKIILLGGLLNADPVKSELKALGIDIIDIPYLGFNDFIKKLNNDVVVITSPYGCSHSTLNLLKKYNFRFFETTSVSIKEKISFINNSKGKLNIIFVGNTNTIEAGVLSEEAQFSFVFYDVNNPSKAKSIITSNKFNKAKTHILYQSELAGSNFDESLSYLKNLLPAATIESKISDENFERKYNLDKTIQDYDTVLFISSNKKQDKYLLEYYHLTTKKILYTTVSTVEDVMSINFKEKSRVLLLADGSVQDYTVREIYNYLTYKSLSASSHDQLL